MKKYLLIFFIYFISVAYSQSVPNLPLPICSGTAEVMNDSIYFFGGSSRWSGSNRYPTVYKYNGTSWSYYDSIPDNNVWGSESIVVGTDVYLFAGWPSGARNVRKYDIVNKSWQYLNQSPNTSPYGIIVEYVNDHIYLFNTTGSVYEYDFVNDSWQSKTPNSTPGYSLSSVVYQDEVYILGFYDSTFYKYSPITDEWTQLAYPPYKITRCAMGVINNKIYCAGGSPEGNVAPVRTVLGYDVLSDSWSINQFEMMDERVWMADVMYNSQFIVLGGFDSTSFAVDIVEEIIPEGTTTNYSESQEKPSGFILNQNYPNPFNPSTKIRFTISDFGFTNLKIYDILGNEVATLVDEYKSPGSYEVEFNAGSLLPGGSLTSGVYFYQLRSGNFIETKKLTLLK